MKLLEIKDHIVFHNPCKMFNEATQSCKRQLVYGWYTVVFIVIFPLSAQSEFVPSGQRLLLIEVLEDVVDGEDWLRTRFVAPQITRSLDTISYETTEADFAYLCDNMVRTYLTVYDLNSDVIVISMMDKPVAFGVLNLDLTQLFEAFRLSDEGCVLDDF